MQIDAQDVIESLQNQLRDTQYQLAIAHATIKKLEAQHGNNES